MKSNNEKIIRLTTVLFFLAVFLCMFMFFFCMHPIVVLDADDWQYVSYARPAIPYWGFWNPSRILPEILMPLCGTIALAVFRLFPIGYLEAQSLVFGIVLSVFIVIYVFCFTRLLERKFSLSRSVSLLLGAVFLSFHFLIFRTGRAGNLSMFSSYDTCCYFYYTVSALLNCSLVMYFSYTDMLNTFFSGEHLVRKAFLALVLYLAVFSNLFNSIILAAYLGCDFLMDLIYALKRKERFLSLLKADAFQLIIILVWLVAVLLESMGGRSGGYWSDRRYAADIIETFRLLPRITGNFNLLFSAVAVLSVSAALVLYIREKKNRTQEDLVLFEFFDLHFSSAAVIIVFLVLLCARVDTGYFERPQVMFGFIFSMFVIIVSCMAYIIRKISRTVIVLPLLLLLIISATNTQGVTFAPSNSLGLPERTCLSVGNDLINQMMEADRNGTERLALEVMNTGIDNNWPHTAHVAFGLKQTLLKHALITRDFEIVPEMSTDFNKRNGIEIEFFWPEQYRSFYPTLY